MSAYRMMFFLTAFLFLLSCAAARRTSKFTAESLKPGITKEEVVRKFGKPYKESFFYDEQKVLHEKLYYKETHFNSRWYEINNILNFVNARFVSLEQGEEKMLYQDEVIIKK
ncbi:hypothetical protein [Chitinophaga solisilvae]|uniref:Lipoprotein SmpA/OmlA domain-containing protein n=1 Tax=Chitinophaga solisilvae TaxID=1233460 RepID=A0A9Q5D3T9_9BACT|nr:hypothetical protein [Chitinophaga solisilvae]NSL85735.1 hypothetical protein [Chitinophaga solisilvae]